MMTLVRDSIEYDNDVESMRHATGAERRRGLRIAQERPVKIFETMSNRYFGGQTQDISSTGLRLELPINAPVNMGETLNIHVGLSEEGTPLANRKQMMPARVVWMYRDKDFRAGKLHVGVEFLSGINYRAAAA